MKTKLSLLIALFVSIFIACNQSKATKEKEPEPNSTEKVTIEKKDPIVAKGVLLNEKNDEPIGMAMVIIAGTKVATMSDQDGKFQIEAPAEAKQLIFSASGFESLKVKIDGEKEMTVKLQPKTE
ncbi:carboxypeptidase-like regulatory domain-containing protein [Sunxiuqinia sp. A32]|uniref:carboxypeptidase-like regulatory domain-containing protein n=1 Tax=Sunxiuqinia sp. A32 TaxID=3461496 RepID=UPI0040463C19